uniref:RING-type E3 ubiquitin transferase n=1 Tax=Anser brachyrhynchus TaxID=132585 RepID=A0A8B9D2Y4_9AVES
MATVLGTRCPICLDSWVNPSYVVPCLHRFCFACIQRWAETKPECPLCKQRVQRELALCIWGRKHLVALGSCCCTVKEIDEGGTSCCLHSPRKKPSLRTP